jgi:hypothetical protein
MSLPARRGDGVAGAETAGPLTRQAGKTYSVTYSREAAEFADRILISMSGKLTERNSYHG